MDEAAGCHYIPVLSDYFSRLTPTSNYVTAECELIVMSVIIYTSSKEITVENDVDSKTQQSMKRGIPIHVELMLTDGIHFRKVYVNPGTNVENKILAGKLIAGKTVKLKRCSLHSDANNANRIYISVHELEIVGDANIPLMDKLQPDSRFATRQQYKQYFLPMLENKITFFDIWFNNVPRWPPDQIYTHAQIKDNDIVEIATEGPYLKDLYYEHAIRPFPVRPLVVRVVAKGNVFQVNSRTRPSCPFQSVYRVRDASGICTMTIFHEANILHNSIREGTLLYVSDYCVKKEKMKDPSKLSEFEKLISPKFDYAHIYPMEILIMPSILKYQSHVSAIPMKIIDGPLEERISQHVPLPQYKFINADMLNSTELGLVDLVGVVIGISRYIRTRQKNDQLYVMRWIEVAFTDESQTVIPIKYCIFQQVQENVNLKLGELVVITHLKCVQWESTERFLETTVISQIIGSSRRNYTLLSKHKEYIRALATAHVKGYIDELLAKFGWLDGTYNLGKPHDYTSEQFPPITHCDNWRNEICSLAYNEMKQISIQCEITKVVLWTYDGICQTSGKTIMNDYGIFKSTAWKPLMQCYGPELPHTNTFPVFYDANTYVRKLSEMQFPPLDVDGWFAKQARMKHPGVKTEFVPQSIPVPFLSISLQSIPDSDQMIQCCFPIYFPVEDSENFNLKNILSLKVGAPFCGAKLANAVKQNLWSNSLSENMYKKLTRNVDEISEEVVCLLDVSRIGAEERPAEVVLRKVYWKDL